jgi:drug/metabolite transporter (DMT)-like permease
MSKPTDPPRPRFAPLTRGSATAVLAAVLFGVTAPLVKRFGQAVGPFATAALLYAGATLGAGSPRRRAEEAAVRRAHAGRLALVALFGAALAPACLAWGLQHTGALSASLLLNLEAVFTVILAWAFYREPVGARVVAASASMLVGGALLAWRGAGGAGFTGGAGGIEAASGSWLGLLAVAAATLGWALDNTLTRPLADLDPRAVVFWKALAGATMSALAALVTRERWPGPLAGVALLACGAAGYGLSLRLYLRAQRVLGAARTGSLFAFGPFVGAGLAFALGDRVGGGLVGAAAACFLVAVWLHATEKHGHLHRHLPLEHEHAHRHDDGHHTHVHLPPASGEGGTHSHLHRHEPTEHEHPHGVDAHHRHEHHDEKAHEGTHHRDHGHAHDHE